MPRPVLLVSFAFCVVNVATTRVSDVQMCATLQMGLSPSSRRFPCGFASFVTETLRIQYIKSCRTKEITERKIDYAYLTCEDLKHFYRLEFRRLALHMKKQETETVLLPSQHAVST